MNITPFVGQQTTSLLPLISSEIGDASSVKVMFADVLSEETLASKNPQVGVAASILADTAPATAPTLVSPALTGESYSQKSEAHEVNFVLQSNGQIPQSEKSNIILTSVFPENSTQFVNSEKPQIPVETEYNEDSALFKGIQNVTGNKGNYIQWPEGIYNQGNFTDAKTVQEDAKIHVDNSNISETDSSTHNSDNVKKNSFSYPFASVKKNNRGVVLQTYENLNKKPNADSIHTIVVSKPEDIISPTLQQNIRSENGQFTSQIIEQGKLPEEILQALSNQQPVIDGNAQPLVIQGESATYYVLHNPQKGESGEIVVSKISLGENVATSLKDIATNVSDETIGNQTQGLPKTEDNKNNTVARNTTAADLSAVNSSEESGINPSIENRIEKTVNKETILPEAYIADAPLNSDKQIATEQVTKKRFDTSNVQAQATDAAAVLNSDEQVTTEQVTKKRFDTSNVQAQATDAATVLNSDEQVNKKQAAKKISITSKVLEHKSADDDLSHNSYIKILNEATPHTTNNEQDNTVVISPNNKKAEQTTSEDKLLKVLSDLTPSTNSIKTNETIKSEYNVSGNNQDTIITSQEISQSLQEEISTESTVQYAQQPTGVQFVSPVNNQNSANEITITPENISDSGKAEGEYNSHNNTQETSASSQAKRTIDIHNNTVISAITPAIKRNIIGNIAVTAVNSNSIREDVQTPLPITDSELADGKDRTISMNTPDTAAVSNIPYDTIQELQDNNKLNNTVSKESHIGNPTVADSNDVITREDVSVTKIPTQADSILEGSTNRNSKRDNNSVRKTATSDRVRSASVKSNSVHSINNGETALTNEQSTINIAPELNEAIRTKENVIARQQNYTNDKSVVSNKTTNDAIDNPFNIAEKQTDAINNITSQKYAANDNITEDTASNKYIQTDTKKPETTNKSAANNIQAIKQQPAINQPNTKILVMEYQHSADSDAETMTQQGASDAIGKYLETLPPEIISTIDKIVVSVKNTNQVKTELIPIPDNKDTIIYKNDGVVKESEFSLGAKDQLNVVSSVIADNNRDSEKVVDNETQTKVRPLASSVSIRKALQKNKYDILGEIYSGVSASGNTEPQLKQPFSDISSGESVLSETKSDNGKDIKKYRSDTNTIAEKEYTNETAEAIHKPHEIQENTALQPPLRRIKRNELLTETPYPAVISENNYTKRIKPENRSFQATQIITGKANEVYGLPTEQKPNKVNTELRTIENADKLYSKSATIDVDAQNEQSSLNEHLLETPDTHKEYRADIQIKQNAASIATHTLKVNAEIIPDADSGHAQQTTIIYQENNQSNEKGLLHKPNEIPSDITPNGSNSNVYSNEESVDTEGMIMKPYKVLANDSVILAEEYKPTTELQQPDKDNIDPMPVPMSVLEGVHGKTPKKMVSDSKPIIIKTNNNILPVDNYKINNDNQYNTIGEEQKSNVITPQTDDEIRYDDIHESANNKLNANTDNHHIDNSLAKSIHVQKNNRESILPAANLKPTVLDNREQILTDLHAKTIQGVVKNNTNAIDATLQNNLADSNDDSIVYQSDNQEFSSPLHTRTVSANTRPIAQVSIDNTTGKELLENTPQDSMEMRENIPLTEYNGRGISHKNDSSNEYTNNVFLPNVESAVSVDKTNKVHANMPETDNQNISSGRIVHSPKINIVANVHQKIDATEVEQNISIPNEKDNLHYTSTEQKTDVVIINKSENNTIITSAPIVLPKKNDDNNSIIDMPQEMTYQSSEDMNVSINNASEQEQNHLHRTIEHRITNEYDSTENPEDSVRKTFSKQTLNNNPSPNVRHEIENDIYAPTKKLRGDISEKKDVSPFNTKTEEPQESYPFSSVKTDEIQRDFSENSEVLSNPALQQLRAVKNTASADGTLISSTKNNEENIILNTLNNSHPSVSGHTDTNSSPQTAEQQSVTASQAPALRGKVKNAGNKTTLKSNESIISELAAPNDSLNTLADDNTVYSKKTLVNDGQEDKNIPEKNITVTPLQSKGASDIDSETPQYKTDYLHTPIPESTTAPQHEIATGQNGKLEYIKGENKSTIEAQSSQHQAGFVEGQIPETITANRGERTTGQKEKSTITSQTLQYQGDYTESQLSESYAIQQDEIMSEPNNRPQYFDTKKNVDNSAQSLQNTVSNTEIQKPKSATPKIQFDTSVSLTDAPSWPFDTNTGQSVVINNDISRRNIADKKDNVSIKEPLSKSNQRIADEKIQSQQTPEYHTNRSTGEEQNTLESISQQVAQHNIMHGVGENLRKKPQSADEQQIHESVSDLSSTVDAPSSLASNLQSSEHESHQQGNDKSADKRAEVFQTQLSAPVKENIFTTALHTEKQKKTASENQPSLSATPENNIQLQEQPVFFTPFGSPVMRGMKKTPSAREYRNVDITKTSEYIMRLADGTASGNRSTAVLHLRPESLGGVTLSVSVQGNSVGVAIGVETTEAQQTIAAQASSLRDQLTKNGMTVTTIEVLPQQQDAARQQGNDNSSQSGGGNTREDHGQRQAYLRSFRPAAERREVNITPERTPVIRKVAVNGSIEHYI